MFLNFYLIFTTTSLLTIASNCLKFVGSHGENSDPSLQIYVICTSHTQVALYNRLCWCSEF